MKPQRYRFVASASAKYNRLGNEIGDVTYDRLRVHFLDQLRAELVDQLRDKLIKEIY